MAEKSSPAKPNLAVSTPKAASSAGVGIPKPGFRGSNIGFRASWVYIGLLEDFENKAAINLMGFQVRF